MEHLNLKTRLFWYYEKKVKEIFMVEGNDMQIIFEDETVKFLSWIDMFEIICKPLNAIVI